jgi:hypothetical protein
MKSEKDDIVQQKDAFLSFTFEQQNDQLLIKAHSWRRGIFIYIIKSF